MQKVYFQYISRRKFDNLAIKDTNTLYFIYNEQVFYKGNQPYGGLQNFSYTLDNNGDYVIEIIKSDNIAEVLQVSSSDRVTRIFNNLQNHINTRASDNTTGHVRLIDTINPNNIQTGVAVTPVAVMNYFAQYSNKIFAKFNSYTDLPSAGDSDTIYLTLDNGYMWIYNTNTGGYENINNTWKQIEQINGILN